MESETSALPLPSAPYRGIEPFRFIDQPIFSARNDEVRKLVRLITIYRGIFFYGESGAGKSSVINAGLIPALRDEGFVAERVRVQRIAGQELVIVRIALTDEGTPPFLPSKFAASADKNPPEPARVRRSVVEIIRGPFESASIPADHFKRRLSEPALDALESAFRDLSDTGTINLTEVQIACLALWENEEEEKAFLNEREHREAVRRLFGNYLDRALNRLEHKFRKPAITALTFLVTSSGTRNIVSEDDLLGNLARDDHLTQQDAREVLKALSSTTRLVFRQTRGDSAFYEISSEFLIPWIA